MKRVLLTGFEPFGGEQVNPALEAANKLHNREIIPGEFIITTHALPTVFGESINTIIEKVQEIKPSIIICTGQAGGRSALSIERIAINI
ncbi:MAG: hypothetical protein UMV23_00715, partial [Halanaerobium sp.]|nr:hypothetical protein [Halanaerobium sp.]